MTLKAFKARFVQGATLEVVDHWIERYKATTRTVTKVQGNGYWFTSSHDVGVVKQRSWSPFPKAREVTFNDDGTFTVRPEHLADRGGFWTLRFAP